MGSFPDNVTGLAFVGDTLYGCDWDGNVYTIDTGSGNATWIGNNTVSMLGMTFVPDNTTPGSRGIGSFLLLLDD